MIRSSLALGPGASLDWANALVGRDTASAATAAMGTLINFMVGPFGGELIGSPSWRRARGWVPFSIDSDHLAVRDRQIALASRRG
jgi:hypothetical protein